MKLLIVAGCLFHVATTFASDCDNVLVLGKLMAPPNMIEAEGFESSGNLKAIYFDALEWKGTPTKVFAWLGLPEKSEGKVPGIVLVHGGGGTAFKEWVQKWNAHGFAAISIAVEGQTDIKDLNSTDRAKSWMQHEWPGPRRSGIYGDSVELLKDQWMYHTVADTVLANSLLRSLPEVDADNVGVAGISWGGVITSTVMGIDDRFAWAIPIYGCGNLSEAENQYGLALSNNEVYKQVWDPILRLERAMMPSLWLSWPGDAHFPLDKQAACYEMVGGEYLVSLIPGMKHGHGAGWGPPDSYAFAKSIVEDGRPWCRATDARVAGNTAGAVFESVRPLEDAVLVSTVDSGITGSRTWIQSDAKLIQQDQGRWITRAVLPPGTTAWFINVKCGGLTASSDFSEIP